MNQAQTPGWPPWPGIRPNRIKGYRNGRCNLNQRQFQPLISHRYLELHHLEEHHHMERHHMDHHHMDLHYMGHHHMDHHHLDLPSLSAVI